MRGGVPGVWLLAAAMFPVLASFKIAMALEPAGQPITADPGRARTGGGASGHPQAPEWQTRGRADVRTASRYAGTAGHSRSYARRSACPGHVDNGDRRRSVIDHVGDQPGTAELGAPDERVAGRERP